MSLLIISDMHIFGPDDPLYLSLLNLIQQRAVKGDTLVLAGDLFDLFVGNKSVFTQKYVDFFSSLREAGKRGVTLHYIEGNHDFLLHAAFDGISNFQMHTHDVTVQIEDKRFFIAHGDTVNRSDYSYRFLRFFFRSLLMKFLVSFVPGRWLEKIGNSSSGLSRKQKPAVLTDLPLTRIEVLRRMYRSYAAERLAEGYDYVVLGHCHDLDEMCFSIGGRQGQYVNVGYPRLHGSYLSWTPGDDKIQREKVPEP